MIHMKKNLLAMSAILGIAGCVMTSCGSTSKEIESEDGRDNVALSGKSQREENIEVKDSDAEVRSRFQKETMAKVKDNEQQLAVIKEKLESKSADPKLKKEWTRMFEKNTALKEKLEGYSATRDTSWTEFSNSVSTDLKELDQSMNVLMTEK
jgi:hypothetical protein